MDQDRDDFDHRRPRPERHDEQPSPRMEDASHHGAKRRAPTLPFRVSERDPCHCRGRPCVSRFGLLHGALVSSRAVFVTLATSALKTGHCPCCWTPRSAELLENRWLPGHAHRTVHPCPVDSAAAPDRLLLGRLAAALMSSPVDSCSASARVAVRSVRPIAAASITQQPNKFLDTAPEKRWQVLSCETGMHGRQDRANESRCS